MQFHGTCRRTTSRNDDPKHYDHEEALRQGTPGVHVCDVETDDGAMFAEHFATAHGRRMQAPARKPLPRHGVGVAYDRTGVSYVRTHDVEIGSDASHYFELLDGTRCQLWSRAPRPGTWWAVAQGRDGVNRFILVSKTRKEGEWTPRNSERVAGFARTSDGWPMLPVLDTLPFANSPELERTPHPGERIVDRRTGWVWTVNETCLGGAIRCSREHDGDTIEIGKDAVRRWVAMAE